MKEWVSFCHVKEDQSVKPVVGFMSYTMMPVKKCYSQLEKEGLAIMLKIKQFHKLLILLFHEK